MTEKVMIVKYGEIAMRLKNRQQFIVQLISAMRKNLDTVGKYYIEQEMGCLIVEDRGGEMDYDLVLEKIGTVFGIFSMAPGVKVTDQNLENLQKEALALMQHLYGDQSLSFKVVTKRSNKNYPMSSMEVSAEVGGYILEHMPNLRVDVHHPDVELKLELRHFAYLSAKVIYGLGGLPGGSSGKGLSLLSGGIDSPVATWMMAKRGVEVEGVYFHSPPYTSEWAKEKVIDLAREIAKYTGRFRLHIVPFTQLQLYLLENVPHDRLTIHLKRAMYRAAQMIAEEEKALALITGESIGQVSSQTMWGINAINDAIHMPVLRPLCGMDKKEIIAMAEKIGTYEISIRPYEDCCTIFVAKHPVTKPRTEYIRKGEHKLTELTDLITRSVAEQEIIEL